MLASPINSIIASANCCQTLDIWYSYQHPCPWTPLVTRQLFTLRDPTLPGVSHPGVVDEPVSPPTADTCAKNDPPVDTQTLDIRFSAPNTTLSSVRTQYMCEQFRVDAPSTAVSYYPQIKQDVVVDNPAVLHHVWVYACQGTTSSDDNRVNTWPTKMNPVVAPLTAEMG